MNTKLDVVSTVLDSVKFAFTKIFMTIRLGWLGLVLACLILVAGFGLTFGAVGGLEVFERIEALDDGDFDPGIIGAVVSLYASMFLWILLACLAMVPFTVVMKQVAAGTIEPPSGLAWFRVSGREVSYVVAHIVIGIISSIVLSVLIAPGILALIFGLLGGFSAGFWETLANDPEALGLVIEDNVESGSFAGTMGIAFLALLVGIILYIWFAIRACLFTTVAAIEGSPFPFRAFALTGGNVWRLIGAFILFWIAAMVIETLFFMVCGIVGGIGGGLFAALFSDAGGAAVGIGILGGLVVLVAFLAYLVIMIALELAFPAKIYASLTRDEGKAAEA